MKSTIFDKLIAELAVEMYDTIAHDDVAWVLLQQLGSRLVEIRKQIEEAKRKGMK